MMLPIKQDILPPGRRPGHNMVPEWITIHQTGNTRAGANAAAHARYLRNNAPNPSWHYTVDDKEVWQHLPLTENGWHAGDGRNGAGNRRSIAIEGCVNRDGNLEKAEEGMAWLAAKLIREVSSLRTFPECMRQHFHWSKKNCPREIRARQNGWDKFLSRVRHHLEPPVELPAAPLPQVTRRIAVMVNGRITDIPGFLINNVTFIPATAIVNLANGQVSGHGDHIRITI